MLLLQKLASSLIRRLEDEVVIENHQDLCIKLLQEISFYIENNANTINNSFIHQINGLINGKFNIIESHEFNNNFKVLVESRINKGVNDFLIENDETNTLIDLSSFDKKSHTSKLLIDEECRKKLKKDIEILLENSSCSPSKDQLEDLQLISKLCFISLNLRILENDTVESIITKLTFILPTNQWFSLRNKIYGKSFLLSSLINLCKNNTEHKFYYYLKNVCENLIKRMEIRREKTIMISDDEHDFSICLLEQLRINIALLEAGALFNDLRYLNAVMKSNDRLYNAISKMKFPSIASKKSINNISIALHYNYVINLQEKFYRSLI